MPHVNVVDKSHSADDFSVLTGLYNGANVQYEIELMCFTIYGSDASQKITIRIYNNNIVIKIKKYL